MKGLLSLAVIAACILCVAAAAQPQARGGRYDDEIRTAVAHLLASKSECKNVKAVVDDGVVTLTGSVELDSERLTVIARVRRIPHVEDVENEILLSPPAPIDNVLYARISLFGSFFRRLDYRLDSCKTPELCSHLVTGNH